VYSFRLDLWKSKEIVFTTAGTRVKTEQLPPPCLNIERVNSVRVLGVIVNDRLTAADHVNSLPSSCPSLLYALRVLRSHSIPLTSLHDVFRATIVAKLMYCASAWSGWCSAADLARQDSFLRRCKRQNYCDNDLPSITQLFGEADDTLFRSILTNKRHVLQSFFTWKTKQFL